MRKQQVAAAFNAVLGGAPTTTVRAPGRVNLIGEHVDYNEGLVLPIAIDRYCWVAAAERPDHLLRVHSVQFDETVERAPGGPDGASGHWSDYVAGVAWSLGRARRAVPGAEILIDSEVPPGGGLGSSAAVTVATATALLDLVGEKLDPIDLALVCQRAENDYVGAQVGIMDQLASCLGQRGYALLIDCAALVVEPIPLNESQFSVVVADTMVKHELANSAYNERREECRRVLALLQESDREIRSLRDVSWQRIEAEAEGWPDNLRRRARHVTTEIQRVERASDALRGRAYGELGRLMNESQTSLAEDYEVSCGELDTMTVLARELGAYGARLSGGGFGGCVVTLVEAGKAEAFRHALSAAYHAATSVTPRVWVVQSADGVMSVP